MPEFAPQLQTHRREMCFVLMLRCVPNFPKCGGGGGDGTAGEFRMQSTRNIGRDASAERKCKLINLYICFALSTQRTLLLLLLFSNWKTKVLRSELDLIIICFSTFVSGGGRLCQLERAHRSRYIIGFN